MKKKFHSDSSSGRIVTNGIFTAIQFGIYTLSGVFFIPFLVRKYGSGTYGLIALAGFLTQYIGLISRCVGNSTARFLNIALNQNDWRQANEIFNTALVANLGFMLLQLPFFALGIWKLAWIMDFPPEITTDFRILVSCNVAVFFLSLITGVIRTPIQAANRLDISSTLEGVRLGLRIVLLLVLIRFFGAKLWLIGVVDLGLALVFGVATFFIYRGLASDLVFRKEFISKKWIRPVANMTGWTIVMALGAGMCLKTDVWMINRFVNSEMAGIYAALLVWPNFLKQISKQLASVMAPVYMIDYAKGDLGRIANLSLFSAKLLSCFAGLVVGCLGVFATPLLGLWLGDWATEHAPLFQIMTLYLAFTIGEAVLWQIFVAMNKVHYTGIVSLSMGVINIAISMTLVFLGFGAMGVAVGTVIASVLASAIAIPLGLCRLLSISPRAVWRNHLGSLLMLLLSWASATIAMAVGHTSVVGALGIFGVLILSGGGLVARVVFSKREWGYMHKLLITLLRRTGSLRQVLRGG
ncbi:MAG: hypothetical protein ABFR47_01205 [Verrucomicrobiota bacterium]